MDAQQPTTGVRWAVEPVDVLIVTAAAGEDDAVRAVDEGGLEGVFWSRRSAESCVPPSLEQLQRDPFQLGRRLTDDFF